MFTENETTDATRSSRLRNPHLVFGGERRRMFYCPSREMPGIMAHGETREEAARQIQFALDGALELAAEQGIKPPAPALAHAS
jgi:predicted RNase H-like HicB family nuclease